MAGLTASIVTGGLVERDVVPDDIYELVFAEYTVSEQPGLFERHWLRFDWTVGNGREEGKRVSKFFNMPKGWEPGKAFVIGEKSGLYPFLQAMIGAKPEGSIDFDVLIGAVNRGLVEQKKKESGEVNSVVTKLFGRTEPSGDRPF